MEKREDQGRETAKAIPLDKADPKIAALIEAWQKVLYNLVAGGAVDHASATSTMLAVAAFWRGEVVGHDRASIELRFYADSQADEHAKMMAELRAEAETKSKH